MSGRLCLEIIRLFQRNLRCTVGGVVLSLGK